MLNLHVQYYRTQTKPVAIVVEIVWYFADLQLPMQSVPITNDVRLPSELGVQH
jgi:hypothetical protein